MFPGLTITVSSANGSFHHAFGPTTYVYPDDVWVGAPARHHVIGRPGRCAGYRT